MLSPDRFGSLPRRLSLATFLLLLPACGTQSGGSTQCENGSCGDAEGPGDGGAAGDSGDAGAGGDGTNLDVRWDDLQDGAVGDTGVDAPLDGAEADSEPNPDAIDGGGDTVDDGESDVLPCPNPLNACGGCAPLDETPGMPCGECEDGLWTCDTGESVACIGAVDVPREWFHDADRDGWGAGAADALGCDPPGLAWADHGGDCDDILSGIHPGARETCNAVDEDCDGALDEAPDETCADACCDPALVCDSGDCLIPCDGTRCGAALELCCDGADLCWNDACLTPGGPCTYTEECEIDEICDPALGECLPRSAVPVCEYRPPTGVFAPTLGCRWTSTGLAEFSNRRDVVGTPVVINLTDDNGDGATNVQDIPDIAFLTYDYNGDGCCNVRATLRIASGLCNPDGSLTTLASISSPDLTNDTGIAAGDLDGDGVPEIVAVGRWGGSSSNRPQGLVAFQRLAADGTSWGEMWRNDDYPTWDVHTRGGPAISLADLEGDGRVDIVVGNVVVYGDTGELRWDGVATSGGTGGIGNNAFLGPSSTVADVDLDGTQEVIAGNTLYAADGTPRWTYTYVGNNSGCDGDLPCDGFNAVGNFDDEPMGEIVIIRRGEAFVLHHDGTELARIRIPVADCGYNESGPPTVADFDGDGRPEIGTASADYYVVVDLDCDADPLPTGCARAGIRWFVPNTDCSSRVTGSSVFDFEGDGRAEVIYADETTFRIFDGTTGTILFSDNTHGSHTRLEMPVIADVDNDGNAEVVIPENRANGGNPGIDIWRDASDNWVRTRRIWNQHGYYVTHVDESGRILPDPDVNWLESRLNNFRQNVQPAGLFDAPDLIAGLLQVAAATCPLSELEVRITVSNDGALSVPAGTPVQVEIVKDGTTHDAGRGFTTTRLAPGQEETLIVHVLLDASMPAPPFSVRAVIDPDDATNECDESNNTSDETSVFCYGGPGGG